MFFFFFFSSIASNAEEARGRGLDNDSLAIYLITGLKKKNKKKTMARTPFDASSHTGLLIISLSLSNGFFLLVLFCCFVFFFNTRLDRFVMEVAGVYRFFFCCY